MKKQQLPNKVKELRKEHNLSQGDLASQVGTTRQTISNIESGNYVANFSIIKRIADFFQKKIDELFNL